MRHAVNAQPQCRFAFIVRFASPQSYRARFAPSQGMRDDPNYRFFSLDGQSVVSEDYLEMRGAHTEQGALARDLLRSGRLVAGPLFTQPDEFQASPEVCCLHCGRTVALDVLKCRCDVTVWLLLFVCLFVLS